MEFAQRLKSAMDNKSMTMYRLAKELGIHQTTIKNWLDGKGEPRISEAETIAAALNVPVAYLMSDAETEAMRPAFEQILRDIGMPRGPDSKATVAETKKVIQRVEELYGEKPAWLLKATSIMTDEGVDAVVEYTKSIFQDHIDRRIFHGEAIPSPPEGNSTPAVEPGPESPENDE